jgi:hypothetical protein
LLVVGVAFGEALTPDRTDHRSGNLALFRIAASRFELRQARNHYRPTTND